MGVAADDAGHAGGDGVDVQVVDGVHEIEEAAAKVDGFGWGQRGAGAAGVNVAADGCDGGDRAQDFENLRIAENTALTSDVKRNTDLLNEIHLHVSNIGRKIGADMGAFPPAPPPAPDS